MILELIQLEIDSGLVKRLPKFRLKIKQEDFGFIDRLFLCLLIQHILLLKKSNLFVKCSNDNLNNKKRSK